MDISRTSAERQAFEDYLRWGRAPDVRAHHRKQAARALSVKALGDVRPTSYYTWRTAHDERVRPSHGANEGQVFAWSGPPATGHPGHEPNCRCVAEAYYGTPFVSDTTLPLKRNQRIDATGEAVWQSIDTLTRPDGSLAQSAIVMRDGTTIRSTFNGGLVVNNVTLPDGRLVRVERRDGVQSVFIGDSTMPLVQSVWGADGPRLAGPRIRVAHSETGSPELNWAPEAPKIDPHAILRPADVVGEPMFVEATKNVLRALLSISDAMTAEPASLGYTGTYVPVLAFRVWKSKGRNVPLPVLLPLTAAQVAESCKRLPEVQTWTNAAAAPLFPFRSMMGPQLYGTAVHKEVENTILNLKRLNAVAYADLETEYSVDADGHTTGYGVTGSSRLDVMERRNNLVCVYDIKTGKTGLSQRRVDKLADIVANYGFFVFIIIEVRPFE